MTCGRWGRKKRLSIDKWAILAVDGQPTEGYAGVQFWDGLLLTQSKHVGGHVKADDGVEYVDPCRARAWFARPYVVRI